MTQQSALNRPTVYEREQDVPLTSPINWPYWCGRIEVVARQLLAITPPESLEHAIAAEALMEFAEATRP